MGTIVFDGEKDVNNIHEKELDAGALFVLKSKGSWVHCGYHLTTSIVAPPLLSLPFAFASLGWLGGILCLVMGAIVTFYSYNLLSMVLEHHAHLGNRHLRFRDMANDILGPRWGSYYVGPIQFMVCYGAVIGSTLLGGQCMKAIYLLLNPNGAMKLYQFVVIFGGLMLILAQMPSFHSLRHINLISLLLCLAYSACATAGSIYIGNSSKGPDKDYSISNDKETRIFGIFNAIAIIAATFGNGIIPEIQATIAPPVKGKMFKGLCICYAMLSTTFFSVAISGYWAFGNQAEGLILSNFTQNSHHLVPKSFIFITNIFTILQLSAVAVVCLYALILYEEYALNRVKIILYYYVLLCVLRLSYYFGVVTVCYFCYHLLVSCTSVAFIWTALDNRLSRGSTENSLSTSEVEVRFVYTLLSTDLTLWNYTGYILLL